MCGILNYITNTALTYLRNLARY